MQIVRKKLSAQELTTPGVRYDPTSDTVQVLVDGTWVSSPVADPRTSPAYVYPPLTTSDPACDASANMVAAIKHLIDTATGTTTLVQMASALYALAVLIFPPLLIFDPLVIALVDIILTVGQTGVAGAFTATVYDHLLCYFRAHVDPATGALDSAGLDAVRTDISDNEDGTVIVVTEGIFAIFGWVGINNAGASGHETGDCSDCDTWCRLDDFTIEDYGWLTAPEFGLSATYSGSSWDTVPTFSAPNSWDAAGIEKTFATPVVFTDITIETNNTLGTISGACPTAIQLYLAGSLVVNHVVDPSIAGVSALQWLGSQAADKIVFVLYVSNSAGTGTGRMTRQVSKGTGANPYWVTNC